MKRLIYWPIILIGILAFFHLLLTGSPIPLSIVDKLNSPKGVSSIGNDTIQTAAGETIALPNARLIRDRPILARDILKYGVEVAPSGEVFALVNVHHWCGHDHVRYHLARVSLPSLVAFVEYSPGMRNSNRRIDPGQLGFLRLPPEQLKQTFSKTPDQTDAANSSSPRT